MCLLLSSGSGSALYAAQLRWVGPQALGDGSGNDINNRAAFSLGQVNEWLADPALTDLKIYFVAVTYTVSPAPAAQHLTGLTLRGGTNRSVALIGISSLGVKPRLVLDSIQGNTHFSPNWTKGILHHWLIVSGTEAGKSSYLKRLVIENLELDGNFPNQGAWTSEANATGYKSFAIDVAAESGWIRNVMVRNFGSVGPVPASHIHSGPGVEAFPVRFRSFAVPDQAVIGAAPNNFPWIVEDLELTDFHSIHGGYGTMIMPVVYQEPPRATVTDTPVAVIRRCQVRTGEGAIAFGTAGADSSPFPNVANLTGVISGRILFQDNVVTGAGAGFNTDTDSIGPLIFDNNAFLDVGFLGFLDQPNSGINHDGYLITNNLVRLRGRFNQKTWTDITLTNYPNHATNPNLPLGRYIPEDIFSGGLAIQGAAGRVYLGNNDFTTWPSTNFYLSDPTNTSNAKFWIVWKMPSNQNINSWLYARNRPPVEPMGLNGTRLSGVSYDFKSFTTLDSGEVAQFRANSPESTAVQHMEYRDALSVLPASFAPRGRLRRALLQMTGTSPPRLRAVREVQIGQVIDSGGSLTVSTRIVEHLLRASGEPLIETKALGGQTLMLRCQRRDAAWNESTTVLTGPAPSDSTTGVVTFTIPNLSNVSGLCRLTVWVDAGSSGIGTLEPDQDGWATFDYTLQTTAPLPVVELTASPDVGDDKNTAVAKRATLQVTRSFATADPLPVNLTLPSGLYLKPGTSTDLAATYGVSGAADYYMVSGSGTWTCASPYTSATLVIPGGQSSATAQVVTRADQLTEQNLIVCRLASSANYTPGASTNVNILIFDGPLWTLYPLEVPGYTNISSAAYALSEVNGSTPPRVGGYSSYGYYSGTTWVDLSKGGYWSLPSTSFSSQESVVYAGISTSPLNLVGSLGSAARVTRTSGTDFNLPHLVNSPSAAWGIVSDASLIVGSSRNNIPSPTTLRPVAWEGSGSTYTAVDVGGEVSPLYPGIAYGANGVKQVVGEISVGYFSGWSGSVAFRSKSGTSVQPLQFDIVSGVGDILYAPGTSGSQNKIARANAVNQAGQAVGYFFENQSIRKGVFWSSTPLASNAGAVDLKAWKARIGPQEDLSSEANSINGLGWIVGWSSLNSSPARAVIKFAASNTSIDWIDLNDPHFVSGIAGWVLQNATAVNDSGHIVGNGTLSSAPRAFVLIPRTTGN